MALSFYDIQEIALTHAEGRKWLEASVAYDSLARAAREELQSDLATFYSPYGQGLRFTLSLAYKQRPRPFSRGEGMREQLRTHDQLRESWRSASKLHLDARLRQPLAFVA